MNFSGKMCLKVILKVTKNQGVTLSLEDAFFESRFRVNDWLKKFQIYRVGTKFIGCRKWYWENIYDSRNMKFKTFEEN